LLPFAVFIIGTGEAFFDLSFLADVSAEALIILSIPCQVQLQVCLGLPDPTPAKPGSIPMLLLRYLSLLPLPVHLLLAF